MQVRSQRLCHQFGCTCEGAQREPMLHIMLRKRREAVFLVENCDRRNRVLRRTADCKFEISSTTRLSLTRQSNESSHKRRRHSNPYRMLIKLASNASGQHASTGSGRGRDSDRWRASGTGRGRIGSHHDERVSASAPRQSLATMRLCQ